MSADNGARPIDAIVEELMAALARAWHVQQAPPSLGPPALPPVVPRKVAAESLFQISEGTYRKREAELGTAEVYRSFRVPGESKPNVLTAKVVEFLNGPEAYCQRYGLTVPTSIRRSRKSPRLGR